MAFGLRVLLRRLGPGVITGAADDDPSGIATYSQAGAQLGFSILWTVPVTWPLLAIVQSISARIGRVTGHGLAANFRGVMPKWLVSLLVVLLMIANTVNIGADLAAMGAAAQLIVGGNARWYTGLFAAGSLLAIVLIPYHRYVGVLKWLTLSLLAYVGVVFTVKIDWTAVAIGTLVPSLDFSAGSLTLLVAILGTTISPYLFFWQSSEEVEEEEARMDGSMVAVYAGSFDPVTNGHVDLIERASKLFQRVHVAVGIHPTRSPLFSVDERLALLRKVTAGYANVEVQTFGGLLIHYCISVGARVVVRGLRAATDFEYELQIAHANADLAPEIDTIFLPTRTNYGFVSASLVREIASHGGDVSRYAPAHVCEALYARFGVTPRPAR